MDSNTRAVPDGKFAPEDWEYLLLQMVNDRSGIDFGMYRMATFRRRYLKRMKLTEAADLRDYVKLLEDDSEQLDTLINDLLIGVTSFFRDRQAFSVLEEQVIRPMFEKGESANIRCWVAGCSNGMEAYSIAMMMHAAAEKYGSKYTIFATDISRRALEMASKGLYTEKQIADVPDRYRRYFNETPDGWRITRDIRSCMVFSHHDILSDPPFAHMDLVSCRNMMIYLKQKPQDAVLGRLNYSLSVGGHLFLGSGETPGRHRDNLETLDSRWRIFRKKSETVMSVEMFPFEKHLNDSFSVFGVSERTGESEDELQARSRTFTSCLEERFFPDCVFIDEDYRILFIHGDMNSYLTIPSGIPGGSLLQMLPGPLKSAVRAGVRRSRGRYGRVLCDTSSEISISVSCISPPEMSGVYLVEFSRKEKVHGEGVSRIECSESDISILEEQIALLEADLSTTRRELRSRTGELQASNEELQTTNEEIRAANEELLASNEELLASNEELQRLNQRLTTLTDDMMNLLQSMDVGSLFLDENLKIRRFTPAVSSFFKITTSDLGREITDFTTNIEKYCLERLMDTIRSVADNGDAIELSLITDLPGYWLAKVSPYRTSEGRVLGTVITFVDVTVLREGELQIARSERKFRGLFNGLPVGALLVSLDPSGKGFTVLHRNPEFAALSRENQGLEENQQMMDAILSGRQEFTFTHRSRDYSCQLFKVADTTDSLCVSVSDVTAQNRADSMREKLETRLHQAQLLAGMGLWEYDREDRCLYLSEEAAELFDLRSGEPISLDEIGSGIEGFHSFFEEARAELAESGQYTGKLTCGGKADTEVKFFRISCYRMEDDASRSVFGYALDVTSEVIGEKVLQQANEKLAETQRIAGIGVIEMEWNRTFTMHRERFSDSAVQVLSLGSDSPRELFGGSIAEDLATSILNKLRNCARTGETLTLDIPMRNGSGENIFIQMIAILKPPGDSDKRVLKLIIMDITRRHQLENELKHSEKLRSVGELAGGIAHDFNNQLMGIMGYAECLKDLDGVPQEHVKGILSSSERAGALVRQLLAFSRKGLSHIAPFDLHHLIDEVISLLKRSIDRRIEIRKDFRAANTMVLGDASEMNNALLNLALNARDAIQGSGDMIFATVQGEDPDKVMFILSDTGRGMSPEIMDRMFEPFFTTKTVGNGTGMGLPAVYGTVSAHNGDIHITSTPGEGTSVTVTLPVTALDAPHREQPSGSEEVPMEGTILLVDDEEIVRSVLSKLVGRLGFDVLEASDGQEALDLFRSSGEPVKAVLMDMTMPRMNGMDAYLEMKKIDPDVRVIILSGHSAESTSNEMIGLGVKRVLQKPVTLSVLSRSIREAISG